MSTTTEIGDLAIPVGFYDKNGEIKKRYRRIGSLMQTTRDDGQPGFWASLNADALSPSLLILTRSQMEKGGDRVLLSVFEKSDDKKPAQAPEDPDL